MRALTREFISDQMGKKDDSMQNATHDNNNSSRKKSAADDDDDDDATAKFISQWDIVPFGLLVCNVNRQ